MHNIQSHSEKPRFIAAKQSLWRLHKPEVQAEYQNVMKERYGDVTPSCVEDAWNNLKDCLLTWWWKDAGNYVVKEKLL